MSSIISIRVPPDLKRKMDKLKKKINWSKEIREFIKAKIKQYEKEKAISELIELIKSLPTAPKGTAQKLLREDRDSH
ncbi:MAG: type II toxin-antitoxin system VapB family antitoxin [Candidatus Asgardarchaeia archaeon]